MTSVPLQDLARAFRAEVVMLEDQGSWYDVDGSLATGRSIASEAVALSRRAGDPAGIADALLHLSGFALDEPEQVRPLAEEALTHARKAGDETLIADALARRALSFRIADVDAEIAEAAAVYRKVGDVHGLAGLYNNAGYAAITQGSYELAATYLDEALACARGAVSRSGSRWPSAISDSLRSSRPISKMPSSGSGRRCGSVASTPCPGSRRKASQVWRQLPRVGVIWSAPRACSARRNQWRSPGPTRPASGSRRSSTRRLGEQMGETRWRAAYADGVGLGFDEAVSLALAGG